MTFQFRDYQSNAIESTRLHMFERGYKAPLVHMATGLGKANRMSANILTPYGWKRMGDIELGDLIIDPDTGKSAEVLGVYPQGELDVYRVTFSDGTFSECSDEHLWAVNTKSRNSRNEPYMVLPLKTIHMLMGGGASRKGKESYFIPITKPVTFEKNPQLCIEPYLLGLLLGDGGFTSGSVRYSSADPDLIESIQQILPDGLEIVYKSKYDYVIRRVAKSGSNSLMEALRAYDLFDRNSFMKFIPEPYLYASIEDRLAVIQGLMDTDGTVQRAKGHAQSNTVIYTTVSSSLAFGFVHLVQSLGGTANLNTKVKTYTYGGEKKTGALTYSITFKLPFGMTPFRLPRKVEKFNGVRKYEPARKIEKIEFVGRDQMQCIRVSSKNQLYMTDNFIVTHNTAVAAGVAVQIFPPEENRVLFVVGFREIVRQTKNAFLRYYPHLADTSFTKYGRPGIGIVMGNIDEKTARIVIATPQTLSGIDGEANFERLDALLEYGPFSLAIYDEAHTSVAKSFMELHRRLLAANPNMKTLGLTATPMREDGLALGQMFDVINVSYDLKWGIKNGYLCQIQPPLLIETNLALPEGPGGVEERAKALDVKNCNEIMHQAYIEHGENRPGVWFMPSVEHSREFTRFMQSKGIRIAHVDGEMGIDVHGQELAMSRRDEIMDWYNGWEAGGEARLLSNYNVLTTGWDAPHTAFIGWGRPTMNAVLLTQALGRGTRLHPDKKDLKILDFALKDISLVTVGSLFGHTWAEEKEKIEDEGELEMLSEGLDIRDIRKEGSLVNGNGVIIRIGNLFGKSKHAWYSDPDSRVMSLSCSDKDVLVIVPPNFTLASKIKSGITLGETVLEQAPDDELKLEFYNDLVKGYDLFRNYTLWRVHAEFSPSGKKIWQTPAQWEAADESIELLFDYAAPLQNALTDAKLAQKNKAWRKKPISEKQTNYLKYSFQVSVDEMPETQDGAAKLISHFTAVPKVMDTVYDIHERCGRFGKINVIKLEVG